MWDPRDPHSLPQRQATSCRQRHPPSWGLDVHITASRLAPPAFPTSGTSTRPCPSEPRAPPCGKIILCRAKTSPLGTPQRKGCNRKALQSGSGIFTGRLRIKGGCKPAGGMWCLLESLKPAGKTARDRSVLSLRVPPPPPRWQGHRRTDTAHRALQSAFCQKGHKEAFGKEVQHHNCTHSPNSS